MIGKLGRVPLREVWEHEERDFTRWLEENIEVLNESLDLNVSNPEREQTAGSFSVDLLAEDGDGVPVVIECQLERSDHDHLGKLITYTTAFGAKTAIWIVSESRPEHVRAVAWLNESSGAAFYMVKVEAVQIEGSLPAPLLTLIVGPSDETRIVGRRKEELAERGTARGRFWAQLLERAKKRSRLHVAVSPGDSGWIGTGAGIAGLGLNYVILRDRARVELWIDRGRDRQDENQTIFGALQAHKDEIEQAFGGPLEWDSREGRRACAIRNTITLGGLEEQQERWPAIQEAMVDAMIRLEKALRPHIDGLRV